MKRWPIMPLGEVCFSKSGNSKIIKGTLSTKNDGGLFEAYSATGQDVYSDGFDYDGEGIVISAVGARCGKCFLASGKWRAIANTHVILPKPGKANVKFLWYLLNDESFWIRGGTAQPFVKVLDSLKKLIAVPSLEEQERIVRLLDELNVLRKLRSQADKRTSDLIPSLFYEMFEKPLHEFKLMKIEEIAAQGRYSLSSGPFGSNLTSKHYTNNGVIVLRGLNISDGTLNLGNLKYISEEKAKELVRSEIKPGDIVVVAVGSSGQAFQIPETLSRAIMSQNFNKITPDPLQVHSTYLEHCLNNPTVQNQFHQEITDTVRSFLSLTKIRNIKIPVPPLPLQKEFANRVAEIKEMESLQSKSRKRLDDLFRSMLHQAFEGEL